MGFPVAATVNATADTIAQLLIGAAPSAFNPSYAWGDPGSSLLSQNHIERRTPAAAFGTEGANPCHWPAVKAPVAGDMAPPPLLDSGCCHLDIDALPKHSLKKGSGFQVARRPRQEGLGALLARLQLQADGKACLGMVPADRVPSGSTGEPSEASFDSLAQPPTGTSGRSFPPSSGSERGRFREDGSEADGWRANTGDNFCTLPREHSLASSIAGFMYPGVIGASKAGRGPPSSQVDGSIVIGTWATPKEPASWPRGATSVSPEDLILSTAPAGDFLPAEGVKPKPSATRMWTSP